MMLIQAEQVESISVLTLTNGKSNTITSALLDEFLLCLDQMSSEPNVKALILRGTGRFFSSGFDLAELYPYSSKEFEGFFRKFLFCTEKLFSLPKPTIASINGHAVAAGYIIASACDFRIMAEGDFKVGLNEIRVGIPFPPLPILTGFMTNKAIREVILQGRLYTPGEAVTLGLVDRLVPANKLAEETLLVANEICSGDLMSYSYNKEYIVGDLLKALRDATEVRIKHFLECWFSTETRGRIQVTLDRLKR